ncbi:hypothetical protein [Mycolicibacterium phage J1]|nr:hypothetical protein [Mycolicibacterium phage J1]
MQIKDKYYKNIERLLYNYNMLKINIEIADKQLEELKENDGMNAITYDEEKTSPTFKITSQTEDTAMRNIVAEDLIIKRKETLKNKLKTLELLISGLNEIERKVIEMYYIEGRQWWQVAYEVKYSERWCKHIRTEAIKKLSIGLYGEEAIRS